MMLRKSVVTGSMLMVLVNLAGCDLLGLLSPPDPAKGEVIEQNAKVQAGDYWTFSGTRTITSEDPAKVYTFDYTSTMTGNSVTDLVGATAWAMETAGTQTLAGEEPKSYTSKAYFSQDENGVVYQHGDYVTDDAGDYIAFFLPASGGKYATKPYPMAVGATREWDASCEDGYRIWGNSTVAAYEEVTTSIGTFMAARLESEIHESFNDWTTTCMVTRWHVPAVNESVKSHSSCHEDSAEGSTDWTVDSELKDSSLLQEER